MMNFKVVGSYVVTPYFDWSRRAPVRPVAFLKSKKAAAEPAQPAQSCTMPIRSRTQTLKKARIIRVSPSAKNIVVDQPFNRQMSGTVKVSRFYLENLGLGRSEARDKENFSRRNSRSQKPRYKDHGRQSIEKMVGEEIYPTIEDYFDLSE